MDRYRKSFLALIQPTEDKLKWLAEVLLSMLIERDEISGPTGNSEPTIPSRSCVGPWFSVFADKFILRIPVDSGSMDVSLRASPHELYVPIRKYVMERRAKAQILEPHRENPTRWMWLAPIRENIDIHYVGGNSGEDNCQVGAFTL